MAGGARHLNDASPEGDSTDNDDDDIDEPGQKGFIAFAYGDFRLLLFSKMISSLALHMVMMAIAYQVYDLSGDAMNLAYVGLSVFAPALGFSLVSGYVADLFDRRIVLAVCYMVMLISALLFLMFSLSASKDVWPAFLILIFYGSGRAFYMPASNALLPTLVPAEIFPNAVAWSTSVNKTAQVAGPALGGFLYLYGPEKVYGTAAVMFAFGIVIMLLIHTRTQRGGREPVSLRILLAGVQYVWNKKVVLGAITLDLFVVLLGGATALLPIYAKDILDVGASGAGILRSAIAFGGVGTALVLTQIAINRNVGRIMFICVTIFGICTIVFGYSTWFFLSVAAMTVLGAADMVSVYIRQTLIQMATPDEMRGRVSAVNSVFISTSNEIGEFRAGVAAAWIGAVPAVVLGGIGSIIIAGAFWKLFPDLARVQRMDRSL
jgi:MFS family permease